MVNKYLTPNPKDVEGLNNSSYFFYREQLLMKIMGMYRFSNVPEHWDIAYLKAHLIQDGIVCVTEKNGVVWPLQTGIAGINVYNQPTECIIANPILGSFRKTIGEDCVLLNLLRINDYYYTYNRLLTRYALLLAQVDGSLNTTLINSRTNIVFECDTNAEVKSAQKIYDDVSMGKPAIFYNKSGGELPKNHLINNVKQTYIGQELLDTKRTIMNEFLTEVGINNVNSEKRERLITDEANANNDEINVSIDMIIEHLQECLDKANAMFGLNVKVEKRESEKEVDNELNQHMELD